jgi:hypothetical protein
MNLHLLVLHIKKLAPQATQSDETRQKYILLIDLPRIRPKSKTRTHDTYIHVHMPHVKTK